MTLNIAKDYALYTGLRYCDISEKSGEDFYHTMLNGMFMQCLNEHEKLVVVFDDVQDDGYSPSFIDEAFGNLVYDFSADLVSKNIELISEKDPQIRYQINEMTIPKWEKRRRNQEAPKITAPHDPWFRLVDGNFEKRRWICL